MSGYLKFECNYGCGKKISVDTDWGEIPFNDEDNRVRMQEMYRWMGKRVMVALIDHHLSDCTEYYKHPDGKPWLRLVQS